MQETIQKNLKMKLDSYCILITDQINLQKTYIKVWLNYLKMETILMNRENSKTFERHRFRSDLTDKLNLKKQGFS